MMKNPFSGLFRARDKPRDAVSSAPSFYFGSSASGKSVTPSSAVQVSAVYACVRVIAETIASLPLHVYETTETGSRKAPEHPLYRLLHDEPNAEMTSFVWRETMLSHLLLWGNAYCQIIRTGRNKIDSIYPLIPDQMEVDRDSRGSLTYTYTTSEGKTYTLKPEDVLHIPGLGFDGVVGYSPIALEKSAIGLGIAAEEYGSKFFSNGARPSGILVHPNTVNETEKPVLLEDLHAITAAMDEGAMTEYIAILTQIQSLLDSGMSEAEVQAMFPEIDFSTALEQIASIQAFLNNREVELPGLTAMFGDALPEEVLTIATDLDMTGAQARWAEFAANPGAITTDAVIAAYTEAENVEKLQPQVDAFIAKYTEIPEGADKSALTPEGLIAYVSTYAEVTNGADVSGLTPENVTAMVSAYKELADGADVSTLTPDEITAYVMRYLEKEGVDTSGLTPAAVTAFVMAYEEVTGGALTTSLTPDDITAMVAKYLEAENVDISALSPDQIEAIVTAYAEATGVDKSTLLQDFTAYITRYDDTNAVKPRLNMTVGIYGYDLMAYRKFIQQNPVEVQGIVKLGEVYENPSDALLDPQTKFWQDGQEIPVEAVPTELLTADKVAVLDADGTLHVLIAPKITGTQEAIDAISPLVDEVDQFGTTTLGMMVGMVPQTTMDLIGSAVSRINSYTQSLDYSGWERFWASIRGESVDQGVLNQSMLNDFSPERVAELSTYVGEVVSAVLQGKQVSEEDVQNLQEILTFLQGLDTTDTGTHILEGVAEGMTAAGWDSDAETVASNLEDALNTALQIHSPSERVKPVGENVSAGVGQGMSGYDFTSDMEAVAAAIDTAMTSALPQDALSSFGTSAAQGLSDAMTSFSMSSTGSTVAASVRTAVNTSLIGSTLRSAGLNAMAGLRAGILAGQSGVISAMRSAARSAVNAAKSELKIHSPSRVFEDEVGVMTMRGLGKGVLKESKAQAKIIRNASRFLTGEAREGTIVAGNTTNTHTYHQDSSVNFTGSTFYIRDEKDVQALAIEIAALTRRRQHGRGLRMA